MCPHFQMYPSGVPVPHCEGTSMKTLSFCCQIGYLIPGILEGVVGVNHMYFMEMSGGISIEYEL